MPLERVNLARGRSDGAADGATSSSSAERFTATPEELHTIQEKMKDPVFVGLMHEYMQSLEDPETRREEEAYLEQAEREAREGGDFSFEFIFPRPAYVVELLEPSNARLTPAEAKQLGVEMVGRSSRTAQQTALRSFLNVCQSEKVKVFTEHATGSNNAGGSNWEVPVSVSQRRVEVYNPVASAPSANIPPNYAAAPGVSQPCILHDVVFHPSTLALAERSSKFMCFLTEIAVEHVNGGYGESNGFKFHRLPSSVLCIGTPQNQTLRTKQGDSPFAVDPKEAVLQRPTKHPTSAATTGGKPTTNTKTTKSAAVAAVAVAAPPLPPAAPTATAGVAVPQLPPHTLTHRGSIDLTDAWRWSVSDKRVGVPEELVVRLTFAAVRRAAALDVTVVPDGHALRIDKTAGQSLYEGLLVLPFTVEEVPVHAQFDRSKGVLTLTLKVIPPPRPDGVPTAEELRRTLPGGVGGAAPAAEEDENAVRGPDAAVENAAAAAVAEALAETVAPPPPPRARKEEESTAGDGAAVAAVAPPSYSHASEAPLAAQLEVSHIGNQDRVAAMLAHVEAARTARIAAAAAAATGEAQEPPRQEEAAAPHPSAPLHPSHAAPPAEQEAVVVEVADTAASEPEQTASQEDEAIPFIRKAAAPPVESDEAAALRLRQQAWAAMMEAEMEVARAREEAEAAEAARAAAVTATKARRKLAGEKERERLEQLAQAKRDAMPLSNKYILAID